jgi:type III secretory pathway component EscT
VVGWAVSEAFEDESESSASAEFSGAALGEVAATAFWVVAARGSLLDV